jgi:hypothetical protein
VGRVTRFVRATAFRRGVLGSSRNWFVVWVVVGMARFVKSRLGKEPVVVERIVLKRGQAIEIRDTGVRREALEA